MMSDYPISPSCCADLPVSEISISRGRTRVNTNETAWIFAWPGFCRRIFAVILPARMFQKAFGIKDFNVLDPLIVGLSLDPSGRWVPAITRDFSVFINP